MPLSDIGKASLVSLNNAPHGVVEPGMDHWFLTISNVGFSIVFIEKLIFL